MCFNDHLSSCKVIPIVLLPHQGLHLYSLWQQLVTGGPVNTDGCYRAHSHRQWMGEPGSCFRVDFHIVLPSAFSINEKCSPPCRGVLNTPGA